MLFLTLCACGASPAIVPPPPGESTARARMACSELRSQTGYEFSIISAELQPASDRAQEFCLVRAMVMPEIRIAVELPSEWNRRLFMTGNGGFAGDSIDEDAHNRAIPYARSGFVWTASDTGHNARIEPAASFAKNRQKLLDYGFRSLHVTAETAKRLAQAYYGSRPSRSYYIGCSTGGRQGLILAQRFPEDFDGIVAGAPVLDFTGTMVSFACVGKELEDTKFPISKQKLLADKIYAKCDAADGLQDSVIADPRRCDFQVRRDLPACPAGTDQPDCFTETQIHALEKMHSDIVSHGKRILAGWPFGAELDLRPAGGWATWFLNVDGKRGNDAQMSESFFQYMVPQPPDPEWTLAKFDLDRDSARLAAVHEILDATDPDLSAFQKHGGKLILTHGWADSALNPLRTIEYYESVKARMGDATSGFVRFYLMPGVYHCGGGPGAGNFDQPGTLIRWVEQGVAPERLKASRVDDGKVTRTRPLCPYPQEAKYKGSGSIDDEASFVCAAPPAATQQ